MKQMNGKAITAVLVVVLGFFLVVSIIRNVGLAKRLNQLEAKNSQLTLTIEEKDKKLDSDRGLYTSLAARLHKEMKRAAELEEELEELKEGKK
ncbi:MAG: hypothetical protein ISS45_01175 [Candidatus Omnitrophica bacterium]|nr:hypothetical protein [Candidatus Omnitrophota bacterium]